MPALHWLISKLCHQISIQLNVQGFGHYNSSSSECRKILNTMPLFIIQICRSVLKDLREKKRLITSKTLELFSHACTDLHICVRKYSSHYRVGDFLPHWVCSTRVMQGTFNLMSAHKCCYAFVVYLFYITLITKQFTHRHCKKQQLF